jgi:hypothetical protein
LLKARNKPFVLIFWSRDPDGTQHNQGDSLNAVTPGINGPTSAAAIRNADDNLKQLQDALRALGLADDTDIVIAADHGFSTISKESATSPAAKGNYDKVPNGFLPPGFLAIDIAKGLGLPLFDPDNKDAPVLDNTFPNVRGNGLIGRDPSKPDVVVAANGGSDLVYVPSKDGALVQRVVDLLLAQDYVSGLFVDDDLGELAGTLPLSAINLKGPARTPRPAIVVNFRSFSTGCAEPVMCTVEIADAGLQQGQGMHGSFSRADTMNFMAAIGPDFKRGFVDERRHGPNPGAPARPQDSVQGRIAGAGGRGGLAGWRHAGGHGRHLAVRRQRRRTADRGGLSAGRIDAVFRRGRLSGPDNRIEREGSGSVGTALVAALLLTSARAPTRGAATGGPIFCRCLVQAAAMRRARHVTGDPGQDQRVHICRFALFFPVGK